MVLQSATAKVEDEDEASDRKPKLQVRIKSDEEKNVQADNRPLLDARRERVTPEKQEEEDEPADRKPNLKLREPVKSENSKHDTIPALDSRRERVTPDRDYLERAAKVEDSKSDILAAGLPADVQHESEMPGESGASAMPDVIVRDGKTLARIEVVLPRWSDVLRRKSRLARSAPPHMEEQLPAPLGRVSREGSQVAQQPDVKMEPVEDTHLTLTNAGLERHNPAPAEVAEAIQEMRNPDVKVKKELLLNDEYVLDALTWEGINNRYPIPVPPDIAEYPLPRAYIHNLYGGGHQLTFPESSKEFVEWHGLRDWAFLTLEWNPHAPTRPGVSGLFLSGAGAAIDDIQDILRTFVRVRSGKWVYMGEYRFRPGKSLTVESWKQQPEVKTGRALCVRVWLRKQRGSDYKVTAEDYEEAEPKMKDIQASITEEDINGAFDRGEEEMGVYTMTCVGYDEDFIRFLVRNVHRWSPPEPKKKQGAVPGRAGKKSRKGTGSKRKPIEVDSESERSEGGGDEPWAREGDDEDMKVPSSVEEPERRSARGRVKRVRTS
ncbi:hypothetical protein C8T65DRAFT_737930 [Cerioporus squamosus]|nr:hypothetical protein C8T65DRAFT_737930 [Cerioporus squamosus]